MPCPPSSHNHPNPIIAILGAGVTGLQTALSILSSPQNRSSIIIIAQHLPGDESIDYTSPRAGGHWRSHAHRGNEDEAELRAWDARTYREWRRLLGAEEGSSREELEKHLGLGVRESIMFWSSHTPETQGAAGEGLWWRDEVSGFRVLGPEELARAKGGEKEEDQVVFGVRYDTVCINVPRYLAYLMGRVTALGGRFMRASVRTDGGVEGVVWDVQRLVRSSSSSESRSAESQSLERSGSDLEALVLATGLLSRRFLPEEEAKRLYPVRGQTVLVNGEVPRVVTQLFPGGEISYVIPRPGSRTTILGGGREKKNWDEMEDVALTEKILERARGMVPEFLTRADGASSAEFGVLGVLVGQRPGRKGGPRVELEKERVNGVKVVYAYGHEGAGYQNSVGSAEKIVSLLAERWPAKR